MNRIYFSKEYDLYENPDCFSIQWSFSECIGHMCISKDLIFLEQNTCRCFQTWESLSVSFVKNEEKWGNLYQPDHHENLWLKCDDMQAPSAICKNLLIQACICRFSDMLLSLLKTDPMICLPQLSANDLNNLSNLSLHSKIVSRSSSISLFWTFFLSLGH